MNELVEIFPSERQKLYDRFADRLETAFNLNRQLNKSTRDLWLDLNKIERHATHFNHIPITRDAFPDDTEIALNEFLTYCSSMRNKEIQIVLKFAAFSILEEISYSRRKLS